LARFQPTLANVIAGAFDQDRPAVWAAGVAAALEQAVTPDVAGIDMVEARGAANLPSAAQSLGGG
jgi:hypothetical protein